MKIDGMYFEIEGQLYRVAPIGENITAITLTTDVHGEQKVVQNGELIEGSIHIGTTQEQVSESIFSALPSPEEVN